VLSPRAGKPWGRGETLAGFPASVVEAVLAPNTLLLIRIVLLLRLVVLLSKKVASQIVQEVLLKV